jgi:hypothetical protein
MRSIESSVLATTGEDIKRALFQLEDHLRSTVSVTTRAKLQKAKLCLTKHDGRETAIDIDIIQTGIRADMMASEKLRALRVKR